MFIYTHIYKYILLYFHLPDFRVSNSVILLLSTLVLPLSMHAIVALSIRLGSCLPWNVVPMHLWANLWSSLKTVSIRDRNERNNVSNHWRLGCLHQRLSKAQLKENSQAPPVACGFHSQRASNADIIYIWWRHHEKENGCMFMGFTVYCYFRQIGMIGWLWMIDTCACFCSKKYV